MPCCYRGQKKMQFLVNLFSVVNILSNRRSRLMGNLCVLHLLVWYLVTNHNYLLWSSLAYYSCVVNKQRRYIICVDKGPYGKIFGINWNTNILGIFLFKNTNNSRILYGWYSWFSIKHSNYPFVWKVGHNLAIIRAEGIDIWQKSNHGMVFL